MDKQYEMINDEMLNYDNIEKRLRGEDELD